MSCLDAFVFFYFLHGCLCLESKMSFVYILFIFCECLCHLCLFCLTFVVLMSFVVCVFNVFNLLVHVFSIFHWYVFLVSSKFVVFVFNACLSMFVFTTSMFLGSLLFIVFELWVECHVCVKYWVSCVFIMCDSFVLCLSNVRFHVCCFCVFWNLMSIVFDVSHLSYVLCVGC